MSTVEKNVGGGDSRVESGEEEDDCDSGPESDDSNGANEELHGIDGMSFIKLSRNSFVIFISSSKSSAPSTISCNF
jgi:hypothetical protein